MNKASIPVFDRLIEGTILDAIPHVQKFSIYFDPIAQGPKGISCLGSDTPSYPTQFAT